MRTMTILVAALAAATTLSACQPTPDRNAAQAANAADNGSDNALDNNSDDSADNVSNATAAVEALPEVQRNAVFLRAISDAGLPCQGVTKSERLADTAGKPTWRAECNDGTAHLIDVSPDGTAVVTSRIAP